MGWIVTWGEGLIFYSQKKFVNICGRVGGEEEGGERSMVLWMMLFMVDHKHTHPPLSSIQFIVVETILCGVFFFIMLLHVSNAGVDVVNGIVTILPDDSTLIVAFIASLTITCPNCLIPMHSATNQFMQRQVLTLNESTQKLNKLTPHESVPFYKHMLKHSHNTKLILFRIDQAADGSTPYKQMLKHTNNKKVIICRVLPSNSCQLTDLPYLKSHA